MYAPGFAGVVSVARPCCLAAISLSIVEIPGLVLNELPRCLARISASKPRRSALPFPLLTLLVAVYAPGVVGVEPVARPFCLAATS